MKNLQRKEVGRKNQNKEMNKWILIIVLIINIIGIGGCVWCNISTTNHLKKALLEQREDIQEVMSKLPPSVVLSPTLNIQDKSSFKILGKGNSGTINAPTERIYILKVEMDSSNITVQAK